MTLSFTVCTPHQEQSKEIDLEAAILYNGIQLPGVWPPRYPEPEARHTMPVPYLEHKPEVIPIHVGRQLLVDDFLIAETDLEAVHHTPEYHRKNPVLQPDREWEKTERGGYYAAPFSDGVWYDEQDNTFKMWYLAGADDLHDYGDRTYYTGYAESTDGVTWTKPQLDVFRQTNIVSTIGRDAATVWLDRQEQDPQKRFKMFTAARYPRLKYWQYLLQYSPDGIHWSDPVAQSGQVGDRSTAFFNPFRNVWVMSIRDVTGIDDRSRWYSEHTDPEMAVSIAHRVQPGYRDKNVVFWFTASNRDPRHPDYPEQEPGVYNFDAMPYESILLGMYTIWLGPHNRVCAELGIQKRNEVLIGYSRDGFHFYRDSYEPFMGVNPQEGAWNWGNVQSVVGAPIIVGDSLYFYVSGRALTPENPDSQMSTGLATMRRDGFVSLQAGGEEGYLTTEKITFDGQYLFVNADVGEGELAVELLDENGEAIGGYTKETCMPMQQTSATKHMITWKEHSDLGDLQGKTIRLKFYLTGGDLYAFWVSPWKTGESRGSTAGGGPGLSPDGWDRPVQ
jgi:hypothetical protein